jgi:RNA polymerase sigma-70 factor, ECF subfamily
MAQEHGKGNAPYPHAGLRVPGIVYPDASHAIAAPPERTAPPLVGAALRLRAAWPPGFMTDSASDRDVLARLRAGDHRAFDEIFRQWYEPVVRSANRVLRDQGVSEELAQDVFLELWRRRESLAEDSSIAGYLMQAVRNRALNHLRHLAVQRKSVVYVEALSEPAEHADAQAQASELQSALIQAIAELPPRTREVFVMSRERGLRYTEIADQLGVTVKAVEANMSRALRMLRERLAPFLLRAGDDSSIE